MLLLGFALLLAGAVATGCGGANASSSNKVSQAYETVLNELNDAAQSGAAYHAIQHAKRLDVADRAAIDSFCYFAWQIGVNGEVERIASHADVINRLRNSAQYNLERKYWDATDAALDKLDEVFDLSSLTVQRVSRYRRACYH
jgi:hypothetical protein